jgi:hypothetical protein
MIFVGDPRDSQVAFEAGGAYVFPLVGDPCVGPGSCATGVCADGVCCNVPCGGCARCDVSGMEGQCQPWPSGTSTSACAPVLCDGVSLDCPSCNDNADCETGHYCDAPACLPEKALGEACSAADECQSGNCVDGLCCDTACGAQCHACDVAGSLGTCTPVMGAPHGSRPPCAVDDCQQDVAYADYTCAGGDSCVPTTSTPCTPFGCAEATCRVACQSSQHCAEDFFCDIESGDCLSTAIQCDGSLLTFADGTTQDCGNYRCNDAGACWSSCSSGDHCRAGLVCDPSGDCVEPPAAVDAASCSSARRGSNDGVWMLALLSLVALGRRLFA